MADIQLPGVPSVLNVSDPAVAAVLRPMKERLEIIASCLFGLPAPNGAVGAAALEYYNNLQSGGTAVVDTTVPLTPTGLTASGAFNNIILTWDAPVYDNHAYTEVWRGNSSAFGTASLLGFAPGSIYSDSVGTSQTYYYWIRFVSTSDIKGPFNGIVGTAGTTSLDPSYVLQVLEGQITESELYSTLNQRINLIDAPSSVAGSVAARVAQEASDRASAVLAEASARTTADGALQQQIDLLSAASSGDFQDLIAAVQEEQTARIAGDQAEATSRETLAAQLRGTYTGTDLNLVTTGLIYSERTARASEDAAIASSVSALSSTVTNNFNTLNSSITTEATTRATADSALSTSITNLSATVTNNNNTLSASIQTEATTRASVDTGLLAQYTVKVDVNGRVSGFGLASTSNNTTPFSEFVVIADRFAVVSPSTTGETPKIPFVIGTVGGQTVVAMSNAMIQDASITNAKIANLAVDTAKIANAAITNAKINDLSAEKITAGTISVDRLGANTITADKIDSRNLTIKDSLGNVILSAGVNLSTGYIDGLGSLALLNSVAYTDVSGTKPPIDATRNVVYRQTTAPTSGMAVNDIWFNTSTFGTYYYSGTAWVLAGDRTSSNTAASITGQGAFATLSQITSANISTYIASAAITTAYIADAAITNAKIGSVIQSSNFVSGSAGWQINKTGTAEFNSGTFRGTLSVKSAASGSRTEITNSAIKVIDTSGIVRVQIGDLSV